MWVGKAVLFRWGVVALFTMCAMLYAYSLLREKVVPQSGLPVYGDATDGNQHTVSDFSLVNQDGRIVTSDDYKDKIYVADFFFATCQSICPVMSDQMERVAEHFRKNPDVMFLSHSVKPDEDSVPVLKQYAIDHHADSRWNFVRGDVKDINRLAIQSYLMADSMTEFVHTQFFALVDPHKRIRGYYDGTDSSEVNKMIRDIDVLLSEEKKN
jgi:protein SCO1/2